jgi:hypothetical protein
LNFTNIGRATGRKWNDQAHRSGRIRLGHGLARDKPEAGGSQQQMTGLAQKTIHRSPPNYCFTG